MTETRTTRTLFELKPDPDNERRYSNDDIDELLDSIVARGLVVPITIRDDDTIVAGHRRYAAISKGVETGRLDLNREWPVHIFEAGEGEDLTDARLIENMQRVNLDPFEEADGMAKLRDRHGLKQHEIATKIGKSPATVSSRLALLNLPDFVADAFRHRKLSLDQVNAMVGLDGDHETMRTAIELGWDVARIKKAADRVKLNEQVTKIVGWVKDLGGTPVMDLASIPEDVWPESTEPLMDESQEVVNPTKTQLGDVVRPGDVMLVRPVAGDGTASVKVTGVLFAPVGRKKPKAEAADNTATLARKKRRAAIRSAVALGGPNKATATNMLMAILPALLPSGVAKLACDFLGFSKSDLPVEGGYKLALKARLDQGGRAQSQAMTAVSAAFLELGFPHFNDDEELASLWLELLSELEIELDSDGRPVEEAPEGYDPDEEQF